MADETANWHIKVQAETSKAATLKGALGKAAELLLKGQSAESVAKHVGFKCIRSFTRAFRHAHGQSPTKWAIANQRSTLSKHRVHEAERLLLSTSLSLAEISDLVGFAHQAHLSNAFKRVHGKSPSLWRLEKSSVNGDKK